MDSIMTGLLIGAFIIVPFSFIWYLNKRAQEKGALFSGKATPTKRIMALIVGGGIGYIVLSDDMGRGSGQFLLLSVALIAYGLGARNWLDSIQGNTPPTHSNEQSENSPSTTDSF